MNYALIDTANTFFRARHVASRNNDTWAIDNLTTTMTRAEGGYKYTASVKKMTLLTEENLIKRLKEITENGKA